MRRLPEKRMLPFLLETHQVTPGMMRELAEWSWHAFTPTPNRWHRDLPR